MCLGINFGVNLCAPGRINFLKVCLIQFDNPVEMGLFGLVVERSQIPIALEQKVFKVVREPCAVGRIMLAAGAYSDLRIKARLFMVFGQENLQSVIQLENMGIERIFRVGVS